MNSCFCSRLSPHNSTERPIREEHNSNRPIKELPSPAGGGAASLSSSNQPMPLPDAGGLDWNNLVDTANKAFGKCKSTVVKTYYYLLNLGLE